MVVQSTQWFKVFRFNNARGPSKNNHVRNVFLYPVNFSEKSCRVWKYRNKVLLSALVRFSFPVYNYHSFASLLTQFSA